MHGHQLRLLAEEEHVHEWTDITVGALYGAIKRLVAEGLLEDVRTEREGNYPERQVLGISAAGREALTHLRHEALRTIVIKPDPFDLAMTRLDSETLERLPDVIDERLQTMRTLLADAERHHRSITGFLTEAEKMVLTHKLARLDGEIAWLTRLSLELPAIIADESARKDH